MDIKKTAQQFLSSREDLNECLVTSDGQLFLIENEAFAKSHAYKIGDNKVTKVNKVKEEKKIKKGAKSKD